MSGVDGKNEDIGDDDGMLRQIAREDLLGAMGQRIIQLMTLKANYIAAEMRLFGADDAIIDEAARDCVTALAAVGKTPVYDNDPEMLAFRAWLRVVRPSFID